MDGVLVNLFAKIKEIYPEYIEGNICKKMNSTMWTCVKKYQGNGGKFWYDSLPMLDMNELISFIKNYDKNFEILTAMGDPEFNSGDQKLQWIKEYLGEDIKVNLVRHGIDKAKFADPRSILIDDKLKVITPFENAGGIGILHTSAENSIKQLKIILEL